MLNDKQKAFVREYIIDFNGTKAAIRSGYSERSARQIADQLLAKLDIQVAIQEAMDQRAKRTEITADRVLEEFAKLAFFDPQKLFNADGTPKPINELDPDTAAAISGVDVVEQSIDGQRVATVKKYKIIDKKGALDSVARHLGMFNDKLDLSGAVKVLSDSQLDARIAELQSKA